MPKIEEKPLLGWGLGSFKNKYNVWQSEYFKGKIYNSIEKTNAGYVTMAYNDVVQITLETGVIGFILLSSWLILKARHILKNIRERKMQFLPAGLSTSIIAILCCTLVSYPFQSLPTLMFFFIIMALVDNTNRDIINVAWKHKSLSYRKPLLARVAILFASCGTVIMLYSEIQKYPSYLYWRQANTYQLNADPERAKGLFLKAYENLNDNADFLIDFGNCLIDNGEYNAALNVLNKSYSLTKSYNQYLALGTASQRLKQYARADYWFRQANYFIPDAIYPLYSLALTKQMSGDITGAKELAKMIISKKVKIKSSLSNKIMDEMRSLLNDTN